MGNSGALKRRSHGSTADIATVQARSPKNGFTPGKIEALNLRLQTRPIQLNPWPTDGGRHIATGCVKGEDRAAQQALSAYITGKHEPARKERDIEGIDIADVLSIYDDDTRTRQVNKAKLDERLKRLNDFWGGKMLFDVTGENCREYVRIRGNEGGAR